MKPLDPRLVEQGAAAEARFQAWLDDSRLPYIYADQTRDTVPEHFRSTMKRPDFFVALPYVGMVAFDVKAKSIYGPEEAPYLVFDVPEVRRMATFDRLFRITTYFACLSLDGSPGSLWFPAEDLAHLVGRRYSGTIHAPLADGLPVDMARPFQEGLRDAISLS